MTVLRKSLFLICVLAAVISGCSRAATPRLYVFDGGVLASDTSRYRLTDKDVEEVSLSVASFLIVHPRGLLVWEAGAVPDRERAGDVGFEQRFLRRDGAERFVKLA